MPRRSRARGQPIRTGNPTYLSAAGVEAFLRVRDTVTAKAGQLILRDPSAIVLTVLAGTRVSRAFHVHTSTNKRERSSLLPSIDHPAGLRRPTGEPDEVPQAALNTADGTRASSA